MQSKMPNSTSNVLFVKAFIRRLNFEGSADPSWESSFVVTECGASVRTIEELAIVALGQWPHGVLPSVDVFPCDQDGVVQANAMPLQPGHQVRDVVFPTFPVCIGILSRPSFDVDSSRVTEMYALLRDFTVARCRRQEKEMAKAKRLELAKVASKREANLKLIDERRQQTYVRSVLAAHLKEDERMMRLKSEKLGT